MPGRVLRVSAIDASGHLRLALREERDGTCELRFYRLDEQTYDELGAPQEGQTLDDEQLAILSEEEADAKAEAMAVRLLSYGDSSIRGLRRKLQQRGFSWQVAARAAHRMAEKGYIKEEEQVYRLVVQAATKKLWGPRRILAALAAKGYDSPLIHAAIMRAEEEGDVDFDAAGTALLHRKFGDELPPVRECRALLYRYGY